eukprot:CAMPEP_0172516758 /NCGR_PEP_ID=MMETSP1066-20121228/278835_1 /TAXON_ID=671091 /ORGANISM="Coscinodiscus wailesii, Strain CCMP2513" /LENGTH=221 /DNA_ID=CAMNT_0013298373 /DNA_START=51 /DNA_END=713 /DNA_ORIENTATION=+
MNSFTTADHLPPFEYVTRPHSLDDLKKIIATSTGNVDDDDEIRSSLSKLALELFRRYGLLWLRPSSSSHSERDHPSRISSIISTLRELRSRDPSSFEKRWTVENSCDFKEGDLTARAILTKVDEDENGTASPLSSSSSSVPPDRFYVSTIIPKDAKILPQLYQHVSQRNDVFRSSSSSSELTPQFLNNHLTYDGGCWLFIGRNNRPRDHPLPGRAEHVDDV